MAGRPKGIPKTGGRTAGTPNKRTSILEKCDAISLDVFAEMAKIAKDPMHEHQFMMLKELAQYLEPKKKAIEMSGSLDMRVQQELEGLMGLTEQELIDLIKKELK
jgi:hypothetical protein